jgi:uncharacterized damage-inducible protein DinB
MPERERLILEPNGKDPEVGRWLAALEDGRRDTLRELERVTATMIDRRPDGPLDSIGTLLYHIALVEADWVATDILGLDEPPELVALLPWSDRQPDGHLTTVVGASLDEHLTRLAGVRAFALERLRLMSAAEFHRVRSMSDYDTAPDWVIHHLLQHEAEHRSLLAWIRDTTPID